MTEKRFDFKHEYITLDEGVFATAKDKQNAELISRTLNQLYEENKQLKECLNEAKKDEKTRYIVNKQYEKLLTSRVNLLMNRPVPQHYNPKPHPLNKYSHLFDCYTAEYIFHVINEYIKVRIINYSCNDDYMEIQGMELIKNKIWDMLDEDSHKWINSGYSMEKYYDDGGLYFDIEDEFKDNYGDD